MQSGMARLPALLLSLSMAGVAAQGCCPQREVTGAKAGLYTLSREGDARCEDGCLYQRAETAPRGSYFCFTKSYTSLTKLADGCSAPTPAPARAPSPSPSSVPFTTNIPTSSAITASLTTLTTVVTTTTSTTSTAVTGNWSVQVRLQPGSVADGGDWGPDEFCPAGNFVTGFQLFVAPLCDRRCNSDDDVGLLGSRLYCATVAAPDTTTAAISSLVNDDPDRAGGGNQAGFGWVANQTCIGGEEGSGAGGQATEFITAVRYLSEAFTLPVGREFVCPDGVICNPGSTVSNAADPIGGMNLDMRCGNGVELGGTGISQTEKPTTSFWSEWASCPAGSAVCGIRSRVLQGLTDKVSNMGQTAIELHCCQLP